MTNHRRELSFGARYFRAAAEARGWRLSLHPEGGFAGRICLDDGMVRYFVKSTLDINRAAATLVARDKGLTKFYLAQSGYPVIAGETFYSARLCRELRSTRNENAARKYAKRLGYPVMVKANSGAGGEGIERVTDPGDLSGALARVFAVDDVALIESYVAGLRDYRLLVLDGEVLLAYERQPLAITGDGRATLWQLTRRRRLTASALERIERRLSRSGLHWSDIPERGEVVRLLDVANLTQGGIAREVTRQLHPVLSNLAVDAAREMGLRYCGVDILASDAKTPSGPHYILELNAAPTIHRFVALCKPGPKRLLALHDKLLLAMVQEAK